MEGINFTATCFLVWVWPVMFSSQAVTVLTTAEVIITIIIHSSAVGVFPYCCRI
jgi:hypothetical protein